MITAPRPLDVGALLRSPDEVARLRGIGLAEDLEESELLKALETAAVPCPAFEGFTRVPAGALELAALVEPSWFRASRLSLQLPERGADLAALREFPELVELAVLDPASKPQVRGLPVVDAMRWLDLGAPRARVPLPPEMRAASAGAWRPMAGRRFVRR